MNNVAIAVKDVTTRFGEHTIHDGVSLTIQRGEIYGLLGGSGSGKSTLLKQMILLLSPVSGNIKVLNHCLASISKNEASQLRRQWGVLFQGGALYTSLTVAENVALPLKEYTDLPLPFIQDLVRMKISMVGLPKTAGALYPAELSGGMIKRAALARALAMDPHLLFLDEPTSGLDPVGAEAFDKLLVELREILDLTVVMVTHDIDTIWTIVDRFAVLGEKKVVAEGTLEEVLTMNHPVIQQFFKGTRGKIRSGHGK